MSRKDGSSFIVSPIESGEGPVVGFIATERNTDALVRSLIRATLQEYQCLVTFGGETPPEGALIARELGATVIDPQSPNLTTNSLRQLLVGTAKANFGEGIILVPLDCEPIDYERSMRTLRSNGNFVTEAIPQSLTATEQQLDVLVAIPAYNEAATIGDVVRETKKPADEVLVVDDGSDDETATVAREAGAEVVVKEQNAGYGAAIRTIFDEAYERNAHILVTLDADGQHDPADIPDLVAGIEKSHAEIAIGSRFVDGGDSDLSLYRLIGLKTINFLTNLSMGVVRPHSRVNDTQSGFRAYSSEAIESITRDETISDGMDASTDLLYHAHDQDYEIVEVGTTISYSVENANNHHSVRHGLTLISNILRTIERKHPILIFGVPGISLTLLGFLFGYWSAVNYVSTETFPVGIAIVVVFSTLVGLLSCFTAIILHSLTIHFDTTMNRSQ
ncbi:dolichyl-phosphate beta-D-mannosyltransferase [Halobacteriales archaeon SW_10_66_29]|nr:MAG: dolichyl-phosphate beta-D-mannosyltransferase [Halobacteriales archaeon SW_10_66_29]